VGTRSHGENMADQDHKQDSRQEDSDRRPPRDDRLDRELDAALAKYAAVEPRAGLEDRVLANLGAERERAASRTWWRGPALGLAAAALVAAVFLMSKPGMWRPGKTAPDIVAHPPAAAGQGDKHPGTRIASNGVMSSFPPTVPAVTKSPARRGVRPPDAIVANGRRRDQFPSPRPLSEEEKLLVRYVQNFPRDAVMIAQAQAESEAEIEKLMNRP